jgi:hypothetical protein
MGALGLVRSIDPGNVSSKGSNVEALKVAQTGESEHACRRFLHEIEISSTASCPEIDKYLRLTSMLLVRAKVDHLFWVTARFLQILSWIRTF